MGDQPGNHLFFRAGIWQLTKLQKMLQFSIFLFEVVTAVSPRHDGFKYSQCQEPDAFRLENTHKL